VITHRDASEARIQAMKCNTANARRRIKAKAPRRTSRGGSKRESMPQLRLALRPQPLGASPVLDMV
jgi:hypothetical protein